MGEEKKVDIMKHKIVGIGGANIDINFKVKNEFLLRDSNPGKLLLSSGGVTRNILENLSRLGQDCAILTAVGEDKFGEIILKSCRDAGIDTSAVHMCSSASSSYISLIDPEGDMFIGACDADILESLPLTVIEKWEDTLKAADVIVCDTNWTGSQLEKIISIAGDVPIFIDPVSTSKAIRMREHCSAFHTIKPNRIELEILSGLECSSDKDIERACSKLISKGTFSVVVSLGSKGCYYADAKGNSFFKEPVKTENMVNASGAGDAFMAGLVYSYVKGYTPEDTVNTALACGSIAVMSTETINEEMSEALVKSRVFGQ